MYYLRMFDPWKGKFCSCKPKYSLAPYTGCDHKCLYCYISTYILDAFNCRLKADLLKKLPNDLKKADNKIPVSISNSSDPYPTIEKKHGLTRNVLELLTAHEFKVLLVTKSDMVLRDLDIIIKHNIAVTMTINTNDDALARRLEPGAPPPSKRLRAVGELLTQGVPVMVRVDPIIPGLNNDVEPLMQKLNELGVKYITTSTYKARKDSLIRIFSEFPELREKFTQLYLQDGQYINNSYYMPKPERKRIMENVCECAQEYGIKFNMCREGLTLPRTAPSCDGAHLLSIKSD